MTSQQPTTVYNATRLRDFVIYFFSTEKCSLWHSEVTILQIIIMKMIIMKYGESINKNSEIRHKHTETQEMTIP